MSSSIKLIMLVRTSYCSSWSVLIWPFTKTNKPTNNCNAGLWGGGAPGTLWTLPLHYLFPTYNYWDFVLFEREKLGLFSPFFQLPRHIRRKKLLEKPQMFRTIGKIFLWTTVYPYVVVVGGILVIDVLVPPKKNQRRLVEQFIDSIRENDGK